MYFRVFLRTIRSWQMASTVILSYQSTTNRISTYWLSSHHTQFLEMSMISYDLTSVVFLTYRTTVGTYHYTWWKQNCAIKPFYISFCHFESLLFFNSVTNLIILFRHILYSYVNVVPEHVSPNYICLVTRHHNRYVN